MITEKLSIVDADTLLSTPLEKTLFLVEGLIPQGVTLLGGSSKIGKSWLMLRLGLQQKLADAPARAAGCPGSPALGAENDLLRCAVSQSGGHHEPPAKSPLSPDR